MYKLREVAREDIVTINRWRNDASLIQNLQAPFRYINSEVDYNWYDYYMKNRNNNVRCAIVNENNEKDIIGLVSLINVDWINRSADFGIMIGNKVDRGRGIGYIATMNILQHGFCNMNLNRIELTVLSDNSKALKLYEKVGFKKEGLKRKALYKNGIYVDMIIMSILSNEFINRSE